MANSEDQEKLDRELHAVFESLRTHVIFVASDFSERVSSRIDDLIKDPRFSAPSHTELFGRTLLEVTNVLSDLFSGFLGSDDEDDSK